jgi:flagellin-like protein
MKKMWKMKKSKEAVSPVIATILMVAITVVLAAVLYVMVMGFGSNPDNNPTMSLSKSTTQTAHQEKILVASISDPQDKANIQVSLIINGVAYVAPVSTMTFAPVLPTTGTPATPYTVTFVDIANDNKVSSGDYFLVNNPAGLSPQVSMVFNILWGSESANIASESWTTF